MKAHTLNNALCFLVCLLLAGLIAAVLLTAKRTGDDLAGGPTRELVTVSVETTTVAPGESFELPREYTGILRAKNSVDLGFSRAGTVSEILVEVGDQVAEGDIIAKLDTRRLELQKEKIDEALDASQSSGGRAGGGVTEADAELVEMDLEDSVLRAPFDATVSARQMSVGAVASPGMPVVRLVQDRELEAWIGLPVEVAASLESGETKELVIAGKTCAATVVSVLPEVDQTARTRTVVFSLDGDGAVDRRPGEVVRLTLARIEEEPGFWVPVSGLAQESRGLWSVLAVVDDPSGGKILERQLVEAIHVEDARVWVRGTLDGETEIVATGLHRLVPGQKVNVVGEESIAEGEEEK